ncbi:adenylate/guanylate cyclase domain-containing protein [Geodermatophilus sp. URMC 64]
MRFGPPVSFARTPRGANLAYQVLGEGELDLVFLFGYPTHLALMWEHPAFAEFLERLGSFARLILFDRVGNGLSDRGPTGHAFEDWMDDISTVLAAVGSRRAAFFGCHLGGRLALLFAATHPERTAAVVTFAAHPASLRTEDYPWGSTPEQRAGLLARLRDGAMDFGELLTYFSREDAADAATRRWFATFWLSASSAVESIDEVTALGPVDIRGLLGAVHAPTLVLHRTEDRMAAIGASRYLAEHLPRATLRELPGEEHLPFLGDQDTVLALTEEFLTGRLPAADADRVVLTVMFTDIVDSTARAAELGDRRWRRLLEQHDEVVRTNLVRFRGREVETTGDGFLATFNGPARAIRAAVAARRQLAELGVRLRVGLHTGECELVDGHVRGIAVHIAARVLALAGPDQVLCTRTVKDLVAGAGFAFADRGTHRLKGVPDEWPVYAAELTA